MVNTQFLNRTLVFSTLNGTKPGEALRCYIAKTISNNGVWQDLNPLAQSLPLFLIQLILITSITRLLVVLLKPLRLPPIVPELIAGVIMGNTGINRFRKRYDFLAATFSISRVLLVETLGNWGLIYSLFLVGLEMDFSSIPRMGKKVFTIAIVGAFVPFLVGVILYSYCVPDYKTFPKGFLFWGVSLSVTGVPVLADILASLKLLHSDIGRTAMSAALINGILSWVLLVIGLSVSTSTGDKAPISLIMTIIFILLCCYVIRPGILWVINRTKQGEEYSDTTNCLLLTGVLACGLVTDILGATSMVGAFLFGLIIPNHVLGHRFLVVLQGFVADLLMPVYYTLSGFRFIADVLMKGPSVWVLSGSIFLLCISKLATMIIVACFIDMPIHEGVSLGLLMNAKGILAVMALNFGYDHLVLDDTGYAIMFIAVLLMTFAISPIMHFLYKPIRRFMPNKRRALQKLTPDSELRVLACVHELQSVSGITILLQTCHPTRRSPICVFAMQLIQLINNTINNTAAFLIIHSPTRSGSESGRSRADGQTELIIAAFQNLERECEGVSVQPLTAMSSYDTMHEDICSVAEDKHVSLIILPFHKRQMFPNTFDQNNHNNTPEYKQVNDNVLANAPCSVGLLVDQGLGAIMPPDPDEKSDMPIHIAIIFISGPDDREALAFAWRMAEDPKSSLAVLRLIPGVEEANHDVVVVEENGKITMAAGQDFEKQIDDSFVMDFKYKTAEKETVAYTERRINNGAETVEMIRSMGVNFDLYIVGRGLGMLSPLTSGFEDWSECPELGAIGDLLLTSDFSAKASVLVVQQYAGFNGDGIATPLSSEDYGDNVGRRFL